MPSSMVENPEFQDHYERILIVGKEIDIVPAEVKGKFKRAFLQINCRYIVHHYYPYLLYQWMSIMLLIHSPDSKGGYVPFVIEKK